jgi:hypothetical protein
MTPMSFAVLATAAILGACATEVVRRPTEISPSSASHPLVATGASSFTLDSGYSRSIAAGTEFMELGRIGEGRVLKPLKAVFTVEGAHMHEAYPVESGGRLVGFYLPVERSFSPLSRPVDLVLERKPE